MARKNPDQVPAWLQALYAKGKGSNTKQLSLLDQFYQNTDAVESDKYDRNFYEGIADQAHTLRDIADSRFEDDPSWPDLIQDEYLALYKAVPKHRPGAEMKPTHRINHEVMHKAIKSKDWEQLRTYTELDQWSSAMAAVEFATRLEELFDELKDLAEAQEEMEKQDGDLQDFIDSLKDADVEAVHVGGEGGQAVGPTTATAIPILAVKRGHKNITFFGCESSYGETTHAYQDLNAELMQVRCNGQDFLTDPTMMMQAEILGRQIRAAPNVLHENSGGLLRAVIADPEIDVLAAHQSIHDRLEEVA